MIRDPLPLSGRTLPFYRAPAWHLGRVELTPRHRPLVMGILNITPDSFYAASRVCDPAAAAARAREMASAGADMLDLGAESTRPGSEPIGEAAEQARLLPVLRAVRAATDLPLSVDTVRASTARAALSEGADAVNDVTAGTSDPDLLPLVAGQGCGLVLMHLRGTPRSMQRAPRYDDVVAEIAAYLDQRAAVAMEAGVGDAHIMVDPGIGFGKTLSHNLALLGSLAAVGKGRPLLLGASRKSFIAMLDEAPVAQRIGGSLAALAAAHAAGATMVRVHDVQASVQFLDTLAAISAAAPHPDGSAARRGERNIPG